MPPPYISCAVDARGRNGIEEPYDAFTDRRALFRVLAIHGLAKFAGTIQLSASKQFEQVPRV